MRVSSCVLCCSAGIAWKPLRKRQDAPEAERGVRREAAVDRCAVRCSLQFKLEVASLGFVIRLKSEYLFRAYESAGFTGLPGRNNETRCLLCFYYLSEPEARKHHHAEFENPHPTP